MTVLSNIFACLVHEQLDCVADLVRNLRCLDPDSMVVLYNGGTTLQQVELQRLCDAMGAILHPQSRPLAYGRVHDFALDCMRFISTNFAADTLTIIDSDQLGLRPGYSHYLAHHLPTQGQVGLLTNAPMPQLPTTAIGPAVTAWREFELWKPFLRRFPQGEMQFGRWTFWPASVFTSEAARCLVRFWDGDQQLQAIVRRSKIFGTEEVILPLLVALLGFTIAANPCSYTYVKFRVRYTREQLAAALAAPDAFWLHPVSRRYTDPVRAYIRAHFNEYGAD